MAAEQELDRNEAATPHKLSEARKRGHVAKSADVVAAAVFAVAVAYLGSSGWGVVQAQFRFDRLLLAQAAAAADGTAPSLWRLVQHAVHETTMLLAPLLAAIVIAAILANLVQAGPLFTVEPLSPDWGRLNPVNGLKRFFSVRTLYDALRACLKLAALSCVTYAALKSLWPHLHQLAGLAPAGYARLMLADAASLATKLALALVLVAAFDWAHGRREFAKKMRMSRRELKDEVKHREGDPRVRVRLRQLRQETLKRTQALRRTRDADVLITNPTHYAVALRYRHGEMEAPQLIGKGSGAMAIAMRSMAARHRVPVVQNRTLARALYARTDIDHHIPTALYSQVARLMVWVLALREARRPAAPSVETLR
jgi:flagellar biosynthetic protein FlhB